MKVFLLVVLATVVESVGDAVTRVALHSHATSARICFFLCGAALLTLYGTCLNLAPVDFGTVTGIYVALLFINFQIVNYLFFHKAPTLSTAIGGVLIVAGGAIIYIWQ